MKIHHKTKFSENTSFYPFDPISLHLIGMFLFIFFPPLITDGKYHFEGLAFDIIGVFVFVIGALVGTYYVNTVTAGKKIYFDKNKLLLCVISFMILLWPIRLYLLQKYGFLALLHPFSRPSSLIDTICQQLAWPYIILLISGIITKKNLYLKILLFIEICYFVLPSLSRSYIVLLVGYFFVATIFYKEISFLKALKRYFILLLGAFLFIAIFGGSINAVRSILQVENSITDAFSIDIFSYVDLNFLGRRLNMHHQVFQFSPIIQEAVNIDREGWGSLLRKLFLFQDYKIHPTSVSRRVGELINYGSYTATDVPRNFVLGNYVFNFSSLFIYNFIWAFIISVIYRLTLSRKNIMFLSIWATFIFSQAFGSLGAFPSTHLFQFIFALIAWSLFLIVYKLMGLLLGRRLLAIQ